MHRRCLTYQWCKINLPNMALFVYWFCCTGSSFCSFHPNGCFASIALKYWLTCTNPMSKHDNSQSNVCNVISSPTCNGTQTLEELLHLWKNARNNGTTVWAGVARQVWKMPGRESPQPRQEIHHCLLPLKFNPTDHHTINTHTAQLRKNKLINEKKANADCSLFIFTLKLNASLLSLFFNFFFWNKKLSATPFNCHQPFTSLSPPAGRCFWTTGIFFSFFLYSGLSLQHSSSFSLSYYFQFCHSCVLLLLLQFGYSSGASFGTLTYCHYTCFAAPSLSGQGAASHIEYRNCSTGRGALVWLPLLFLVVVVLFGASG